MRFPEESEKVEIAMEAIRAIRNIRAEADAGNNKKLNATIVASDEIINKLKDEEKALIDIAGLSGIAFANSKENIPDDAMTAVISGAEIYIPLEDLVDFKAEAERLTKEKKRLEGEVKRAEGKLANEGFVSKAPAKLIEEEKAKLADYQEMLAKVVERLESIEGKN